MHGPWRCANGRIEMLQCSVEISNLHNRVNDKRLTVSTGVEPTDFIRSLWQYRPDALCQSQRVFLDAATYLYKRLCPSVSRSVGWSIGWSVGRSVGRFVGWSVNLFFFFAENSLKMVRTNQETFCKAWIRSMSVKMFNCSRIVDPLRNLSFGRCSRIPTASTPNKRKSSRKRQVKMILKVRCLNLDRPALTWRKREAIKFIEMVWCIRRAYIGP